MSNLGKTHFKKGSIPWNKGKKGIYTKDSLNLMSKKKLGKRNPHNKEWNKKIGDSQKGERGNNWGNRGELGNSYKNGLTPLYLQIRHCFKMRQFKDDCYYRDDFICLKCGKRGGNLCVHHIKNFADIIKENNIVSLEMAETCVELWNINNGVVFCKDDHRAFHKKFGFSKNNREQILTFIKNR